MNRTNLEKNNIEPTLLVLMLYIIGSVIERKDNWGFRGYGIFLEWGHGV